MHPVVSVSARHRIFHVATAFVAVVLAGMAIGAAYQKSTLPDAIPAVVPAPGGDIPALSWADLRGYNYRSKQASEVLERQQGKVVRIAGFMIPLEDEVSATAEFLLVPFVGACIHSPPPPPNQIVRGR